MTLHHLLRRQASLISTTTRNATFSSSARYARPATQVPFTRPSTQPPESLSVLVGRRLALHKSIQLKISTGDITGASNSVREAISNHTRSNSASPTVFTCNAVLTAMHRAGRFDEVVSLFRFYFNQSDIIPNMASYNILINTHCDAGRVEIAIKLCEHILANTPFTPSSATYRHLAKGLLSANRPEDAFIVKCLSKAQVCGEDETASSSTWLPHSWIVTLLATWREKQQSEYVNLSSKSPLFTMRNPLKRPGL